MSDARQLPEFVTRLLADSALTCVDVGSRNGLPEYLLPFAEVATFCGFDPDAAACERDNASSPDSVTFYPAALARETGEAPLHVTAKPSGSSLYEPDQRYVARYDSAQFSAIDHVETVPLYSYADARARFGLPHPNFMKIDVQGAELDVLQGLDEDDWSALMCVQAEVEFVPLNKQQPLFGDLDAYLRSKGFTLFDLRTHRKYLSKDGERDHYLRRLGFALGTNKVSAMLVAGDTLYFRDPWPVEQVSEPDAFAKQFVLFVMFRYFDHALWWLEQGQQDGLVNQQDVAQGLDYLRAMAGSPTVGTGQRLIDRVYRTVLRKLNIHMGYKAFWAHKRWPNQ